ncbi:MAG: mannose-1-phosphate guanylyltransferase [Phenylobacterium sp.]|nr:MAG: mannose-1-phosphate guanylyltransferase [Phenylobacterium sp.]
MAVIPVIMCGGGGARLWPASGPERPKQFLDLLGPLSSFQEAVLRAVGLADAGVPVVVAGVGHLGQVRAQLAEVGVKAVILLEPEARDSSAAIAAALAWIETHDPEAVVVIMSADHHLPDRAAFAAAIAETLPAAGRGAIVTLGIRPAAPATAYGYIRPAAAADRVKPVAAFVEKPDAARARAYVAEGYLWNSGYFVAGARTLIGELQLFAPEVLAAARAAVAEGAAEAGVLRLGEAFRSAPRVSIDYAVMEKTKRAAVLPVDFEWSDLGAWDAIWAAAEKDPDGNVLTANSQALDAAQNLVVAPDHVHVALLGTRGLGVIVQGDAVLVCDLGQSQLVKTIAGAAPVAAGEGFASVAEAADWYEVWLRTAALPLWATAGVDPATGAFREALSLDGRPQESFRRARVQARQVFVYATATKAGIEGPWLAVAERGFQAFAERYRRPDRLFANAVELASQTRDESAPLYEQAFALLAMAALHGAQAGGGKLPTEALGTGLALQAYRHAAGGFRELGAHAFQANAHMHLLEAALAWDELDVDPFWGALADEIVTLALGRFIDPAGGFLREFFDADWRPAAGDDGRAVEPGHQFEWAWLLDRWGRARDDAAARAAARTLFQHGLRGVTRGVAVDGLWDDLTVRDPMARLWPQTEHLKAALLFGEDADVLTAAHGLRRYLDAPARGAWRDKLRPDGSFVDEPAPASSFYHVLQAVLPLVASRSR